MVWALLAANVALVIATVAYTLHTRAMATEMRQTRLLSVRPRLALDLHMLAPTYGHLRITNLGAGVSLDVRATLRVAVVGDERSWTTPILRPGESVEFSLRDADGRDVNLAQAAGQRAVAELEGTMRDIYGNEHMVSDAFNIAEWWDTVTAAEQAYADDPARLMNQRLKKLVSEVAQMRKTFPREIADRLAKARAGSGEGR